MKKEFDFENENNMKEMTRIDWERARILVKIIPFVLIIAILAVTLLVSKVNNQQEDSGFSENSPELLEETIASAEEQVKESILPAPTPEIEQSPTPEPENPTPTPYHEVMEEIDYSKVKFDTKEQLAEMMAYWEDNNQKALDDLANLDRFRAMSWHLKETEDFYYYGDTNADGRPDGKGIAVYADNQYYYGEWADGKRSGNGTWMHYHIHVEPNKTDIYTYHQYAGSWKDDLPHGEGFEHYDFNSELLKENIYYNSNLIGSYLEGLIDGEFYITTIENNNNMREWEAQADHGAFIYQNEDVDTKGRRAVQAEIFNSENFIWMLPKDNHDIGVPCLISPYRQ